MMPSRADKIPGYHVVRDANGQPLAYICSRDNEAEARQVKGERRVFIATGGSAYCPSSLASAF
jgi:hypothetical protein